MAKFNLKPSQRRLLLTAYSKDGFIDNEYRAPYQRSVHVVQDPSVMLTRAMFYELSECGAVKMVERFEDTATTRWKVTLFGVLLATSAPNR